MKIADDSIKFYIKALLIAGIIAFAAQTFAQDRNINFPDSNYPAEGNILYGNTFYLNSLYESKLEVDSVAYVGQYSSNKEICNTDTDSGTHYWVDEENAWYGITTTCLVNHDARGCEWEWPAYWRICKTCLRKEHVSEIRTLKAEQKTEFELLDEKVSAILKGK